VANPGAEVVAPARCPAAVGRVRRVFLRRNPTNLSGYAIRPLTRPTSAATSAARIGIARELTQLNAWRRLPAGFAVLGDDVGENAAAHVELRGQAHEARIAGAHQVVEDAIGDVFVEMPFLAERPDVELEALQLHATLVGDVIEIQGGEIRLAGFRAQAGEFRDFHMDVVIAAGIRVVEGFQGFAGQGRHGGEEKK